MKRTYIAFLRGINVGANNSLPMSELMTMCNEAGFENVKTFIQSGNVIFESELPEKLLVKKLEDVLYLKIHKRIPVIIRTAEEIQSVVSDNPFPGVDTSKIGVVFYPEILPADVLKGMTNKGPEKIVIHLRELYIYYPEGMGRSKLKLPDNSEKATVRNINTITKIAGLSGPNKDTANHDI